MNYPGYEPFNVYFGDLHSHCDVGYGHGSLEDAYRNAQLQLDFVSVTAHALWPDIPEGVPHLADVVAYHKHGFERAARHWSHYLELTKSMNHTGRFVTFPSFEWHSLRYGDHNVYFNTDEAEILPAADLTEMRQYLRRLAQEGRSCFVIPHHIGYRVGHRGISWDDYTPEFSPVVEVLSMHGFAESKNNPVSYLHTMGPVDEKSSLSCGLQQGHIFGVIGSTDHHSAHPGSYGSGRVAVWSENLSREAIWEAIAKRRTYALTGDKIALAFSINQQPMGSIMPFTPERWIDVAVVGGGAIDTVEVLYNNQVLQRWFVDERVMQNSSDEPVKVLLELGWGERNQNVDWHVELAVEHGALTSVEPRLRGHDILAPQATEQARYAFSSWERVGENGFRLNTRTWGNPATTTSNTQGICLEIATTQHSRLIGHINDQPIDWALSELRTGARTGYLGGFLTPAYCFHRAVPQSEYCCRFAVMHFSHLRQHDWYSVRVRQRNGQWAWSSSIWVSDDRDILLVHDAL